jgi:DNA-binding MarR family transcriptional regulator
MYKARAKELFQYGITPEEAAVLFIVHAIGRRATPAEISRWLLREPHSTSGLINRMEKEGLVRKVKDLERKNMVRVAITKKGRQLHNQSSKRESIHRIMSSLAGDECQQMWECLYKLRDRAFEEIGIVRKPPFPPS